MKYIVCGAWSKNISSGTINIQSVMRSIEARSELEAIGSYLLKIYDDNIF